MNLTAQLHAGNTRVNRDFIARWVGRDPERFAGLMELYLRGDLRDAQLAAGVVCICVDRHPGLLRPWLPRVVDRMRQKDIHDAVRRIAVRALASADIPIALQGRVADLCFKYLGDLSQPIAVRVFSMTVLENIAGTEPDLRHELIDTIEATLPFGTAALQSRARHVLRRLKKSPGTA